MKLAARTVRTDRYPVVIGEEMFSALERAINLSSRAGGLILLHLDPLVQTHCLPVLLERCPSLGEAKILITPEGESNKTLSSATLLWQKMSDLGAGRDALLVNLGGGVITDLGGFAAAAFHRGIDTWHIPTTLIGQIDAAIGGKTAVNLNGVKNQTGFFYNPVGVGIWPGFLETLPKAHRLSGLAEVAKSALIRDAVFWRRIARMSVEDWLHTPVADPAWLELIQKTIKIKLEIVRHDPLEHRQRKLLNFGHTTGHAFESWFLKQENPVMHGEAVAAGMICEAALSRLRSGLTTSGEEELKRWIMHGFNPLSWPEGAESSLIDLMRRDKKNRAGQFRFTLLGDIGRGRINQACTDEEILRVLKQYRQL